MSTDIGGGPAFPLVANNWHRAGMTLRDYFAAKAMQGLLSDPDWRQDMDFEETAYHAYEQAEKMLKVRGQL
jgi:hypothetical protein